MSDRTVLHALNRARLSAMKRKLEIPTFFHLPEQVKLVNDREIERERLKAGSGEPRSRRGSPSWVWDGKSFHNPLPSYGSPPVLNLVTRPLPLRHNPQRDPPAPPVRPSHDNGYAHKNIYGPIDYLVAAEYQPIFWSADPQLSTDLDNDVHPGEGPLPNSTSPGTPRDEQHLPAPSSPSRVAQDPPRHRDHRSPYSPHTAERASPRPSQPPQSGRRLTCSPSSPTKRAAQKHSTKLRGAASPSTSAQSPHASSRRKNGHGSQPSSRRPLANKWVTAVSSRGLVHGHPAAPLNLLCIDAWGVLCVDACGVLWFQLFERTKRKRGKRGRGKNKKNAALPSGEAAA